MRVVVRVAKGIGAFVRDTVAEALLELLLCLLVVGVLGGVAFLVFLGYAASPAGTVTAAGLFVAFSGYGAVEMFRGPGRRRQGRLTAVAVATSGAVATLAALALHCGCRPPW